MNGNERLIRLQRERRAALAAARKESGFTLSLRQAGWFFDWDRTPSETFGLAWEAPTAFTQAEYDHAVSTTAAMGDHKDGKPYTALRGDSDRVVTVEGESLTVSQTVANVLRKEAFQRAVTAPADKVSAAITVATKATKGCTAEQAAKIASLLGLQVDPEWEPTAEEAVKVSSGGGGFRRQQQVIHQQPAQAAATVVAAAPAPTARERLVEAKAMLDDGLIDADDYAAIKAKIVADLVG